MCFSPGTIVDCAVTLKRTEMVLPRSFVFSGIAWVGCNPKKDIHRLLWKPDSYSPAIRGVRV